MGGVIALNPFTVAQNSGGTFHLATDNTKAFAMLQINFSDRYAWNAPAVTKFATNNDTGPAGGDWNHPIASVLESNWDFQMRAAYVFQEGLTNASTIIGSGDFAGEFALGKRLFETKDLNSQTVHSVNIPEMNFSFVTDRGFSDVHSTLTLGIAYVASFVPPWSTTGQRARILLRPGLAYYDLPVFIGNTSNIQTDHGAPEYHGVIGWAVETEVAYPLGKGTYVAAGARVYGGNYPAPWTVWAGYSLDLNKLAAGAKALLP